jgi:cytochrome P450
MSIEFDPHDPTFVDDGIPFDVLARIRAEDPVYRTPQGAWYLSRYGDIEGALKDVETFRAELGPITGIEAGFEAVPPDEWFLSEIAEPRHGQIRRLFNSAFAAHRLRAIESYILGECDRLIDSMLAADVADLHDDYAARIPAIAMARIMGLDRDAVDEFVKWSWDGTLMSRPSTPGVPDGGPASHVYFAARLAEQRSLPEPTSHVFKVLLEARIEGEPLTDREITTQLHFMIQAGVHTTRSLMTHLVNRLLHDRELFQQLEADRSLVSNFVEESLRHDAPVQRTTRRCTRDVVYAGVRMCPGDWVEMGIGSGNLDEAVYRDGDEFRLDRDDPRHHLGFGAGSHICPGATLARLEGSTAVTVLLDRVTEIRPVDGVRYPPIPGSLGHRPIPAVLVAR